LLATTSATSTSAGFASHFFANLFTRIKTWFASAQNGIADLFTKNLHAENVYAGTGTFHRLCVDDVCITRDQFMTVFGAGALQTAASGAATPPLPCRYPHRFRRIQPAKSEQRHYDIDGSRNLVAARRS
jgi:hypothetical protein